MKKKLKVYLKYFLLGALLIWPPIHMGLSKNGVINSWKFSGWGMYASTSPRQLKLKIIFLKKGIKRIPKAKLSLGEQKDTFVINPKGFYVLPSSIGIPTNQLMKLNTYSRYMRTLVNPSSAKNYIGMKRKIIEKKTGKSFPIAFLFASETRINPEKRFSFVNTKVFLYKNDAVQYIGTFRGTEHSEIDLIKLLNRKLWNSTNNLVSISKQ